MANGRSSQDERKLEGGSEAPKDNGLHPGFYIAYVTIRILRESRVQNETNNFLACGLL